MLNGFLLLIVGIVLILLSYVSLKLSSSFKKTGDINKEQILSKIKNKILYSTENKAMEVFKYVFISSVLFVIGICSFLFGIFSITGVK